MYPTLDLKDLYQSRVALWDKSKEIEALFDATRLFKNNYLQGVKKFKDITVVVHMTLKIMTIQSSN